MKIAMIMLAAGNSRRFGANKLLYEIDGIPMYRHVLEQLDDTIETIRGRFGKGSIYSASLLGSMKASGDSSHEVIMPGIMYA